MYNPITTEDFDKWITAESRTFEVKCDVVDGADTVTMSGTGQSGDIISMEWNNVICSNDGLQIGTCCMDEFRMTYRNKDSLPSLMDKEIHPYVGLVCPHENTGDVTVWIPLGVFYVTNTETEDEEKTFTLTAYDGMQRFMGDFDATAIGVTFPINAWSLLTAIASYFGVTIEYDAELYTLLSSDDYILTTSDGYTLMVQSEINANKSVSVVLPLEGTYRDYIGWIAGLVGANAHMGRTGRLRIARYTDYGLKIPRTIQHMGGTKINFGGSVSYTNIVSGTDENPVYATSYSGNAITYTNPFITVTELDKVCDELIGEDGITVTPCDIAWRSDPRVDAGDIVYAEDKDGNYFPVYVMERVARITGGLAEDLHCYVETEVQKVLNKSPLVTKITNIARNSELSPAYIINNTVGTFEWIDNGNGTNGGFTIYEADDTSSWLRCTAGGLGISADGGLTYTNAITKNGVTATQIDVNNASVDVMSVYCDLDAHMATIRLNNPETGARGYDVNVTNYGSGFHLYRVDTGTEVVGSSCIGNTSSANTQFHLDDPDDGLSRVMLSTYKDYSTGTANNHISVDGALGTRADAKTSAYMGSSLNSSNVLINELYLANRSGSKVFSVSVSDDNSPLFYVDGHTLTWKTFTISGTTYHVLGY